MTSAKGVRDDPSGWCAAMADTVLPFSRSLSARSTSAGPMSMPHMMVSASMSLASSARAEKRVCRCSSTRLTSALSGRMWRLDFMMLRGSSTMSLSNLDQMISPWTVR